jgi:hypothetical protein
VKAPLSGGTLITKPITLSGQPLKLNFATSAAGGIKVEIQEANGQPISGFALTDSSEVIGNEIARSVRWKDSDNLSTLAGRSVRLKFELKDADLYAMEF